MALDYDNDWNFNPEDLCKLVCPQAASSGKLVGVVSFK